MRIAVVGSGIAGLSAAWLLARPESGGAQREVHLFEAADRLGGHTHTHDVDGLRIDSGFIVYNEPTYPNLTRLFAELGVATQSSDMSFGLADRASGFEYAGSREGLFPDAAAARDARRWRLAAGILRFNRLGRRLVGDPRTRMLTLGRFLEAARLTGPVADLYVLPMAAAIWSTGTGDVRDFPLGTFLEFFDNHGLLGVASHHPWRTVTGGSSSYIAPLSAPYADRVHLSSGVRAITRHADGVELRTVDDRVHAFDAVVVAAHADDALGMLADPSEQEKELLGAWQYSTNVAWLHTDLALMPRARSAWASWNVLTDDAGRSGDRVSLTYWMNRLQSLDTDTQYLVTLNPSREPAPEHVVRRMTYRHPLFTPASVATQPHLDGLNGRRRTFFTGAWQRYGFHEDGLWASVRVARHFGVRWGA